MADAGVVFGGRGDYISDPDPHGAHDVREPARNAHAPDADAMFDDPFLTLDDIVADDMIDLLLQHQFDGSPSPSQPPPAPRYYIKGHRQKTPSPAWDTIDLTASDDFVYESEPEGSLQLMPGPSAVAPLEPILTEGICLAKVLQVLPDISRDHVLHLFRESPPASGDSNDWIQDFIGTILESGKYPTQRESERGTKRKHQQDEDDWAEFEKPSPDDLEGMYKLSGSRLLRDAFPNIRYMHIQSVFKKHRSVFKAYAELIQDATSGAGKLEKPRKKSRRTDASVPAAANPLADLPADARQSDGYVRASRELDAARRKRESYEERQRKLDAAALAEVQNEMRAQQEGTMNECGCCCSEYPLNRMVACESPDATAPHWLCRACVKTHVETEIGQGRYKIVCFHVDGCTHGFSRGQLTLAVPQQQIDKLGKLQQEDEIRRAGLEGLEECPFCDFKAICPPADVDKEFRCGNPDCAVVSCRLCKLETHIPLSCEERAKEKGVDARHAVEEAMTAALIRICNNCKKTFVKDFGCNKMSCTGCGNVQCYVCGKDVKDYRHFSGSGGTGTCPLHDNTDKRHQDEVEKAEQEALKKVRDAHPDLDEDDLKIKVSEEVRLAEQGNIRRINDVYGFAQRQIYNPMPFQHFGPGGPERRDYEAQLRVLEMENNRRLHLARGQPGQEARPVPLPINRPQQHPPLPPPPQPPPELYRPLVLEGNHHDGPLPMYHILYRNNQVMANIAARQRYHIGQQPQPQPQPQPQLDLNRQAMLLAQQQRMAQQLQNNVAHMRQIVEQAGGRGPPQAAAPPPHAGADFNLQPQQQQQQPQPQPQHVQHHVHMFANAPPPVMMPAMPAMPAMPVQQRFMRFGQQAPHRQPQPLPPQLLQQQQQQQLQHQLQHQLQRQQDIPAREPARDEAAGLRWTGRVDIAE